MAKTHGSIEGKTLPLQPAARYGVFVLLLGIFASTTHAQSSTEVGSLEWFRAQWTAAEDWLPETPVFIELVRVEHSRTTAAQVEELRAEIEGKIDHPNRAMLPALAYDATHRRRELRMRVWIDGDIWRFSTDAPEGSGSAVSDFAVGPAEGWAVFAEYLRVYHRDRAPDSNNNDGKLRLIRHYFQLLFHGGFVGSATAAEMHVVSSTLHEDGSWEGVAESKDGQWRVGYTGHLTEDGSDIRVHGSRQLRAPLDPYFYDGFDVVEWGQLPGHDRPVPTHIILREAMLERPEAREPWPEMMLIEYEPINTRTVREVVATPVPGQPDPIRGVMGQVTTLMDFRPDKMVVQHLDGDQVLDTKPITHTTLPPSRSGLRVFGWVFGPLLVAATSGLAVYIRHRRR